MYANSSNSSSRINGFKIGKRPRNILRPVPSSSLVVMIVGAIIVFISSSTYILITIHMLDSSMLISSHLDGGDNGDCMTPSNHQEQDSQQQQQQLVQQNARWKSAFRQRQWQLKLQQQQHPHRTVYTHSNPPNHYPYEIIHTITTRFMIGQPKHAVLARARYMLFETFCYPSMFFQTRRNVFWMVVADPGLPSDIIDDLMRLLDGTPSQFAYLVLSNRTEWAADGVGVPNSTSYGVHWPTVADDWRSGRLQVLTGNTTHLVSTLHRIIQQEAASRKDQNDHVKSKPILVVETLLDGDDGLNNAGVEWIQDMAVQRTMSQQAQLMSSPSYPTLNSTWWLLTGTDHIEWHNRDIFTISHREYDERGLQSGLTGWRHAPYFATSAGFTRIGLTHSAFDNFSIPTSSSIVPNLFKFPKAAYSNHALTFYFPECDDDDDDPFNVTVSHCYRRLFEGRPFVLKSRSITSDSMEHMNSRKPNDYRDVGWVNTSEIPLLLNESEYTWDVLRTQFSVNRYDAWETSLFLYRHRMEILLENKGSRCAPGFPCNASAKKAINQIRRYWLKQDKRKGGIPENEQSKERRKRQQEKTQISFQAFLARQNHLKGSTVDGPSSGRQPGAGGNLAVNKNTAIRTERTTARGGKFSLQHV